MDWKGKVLRRRYRLDERVAVGKTVEVFRAFDLLEEEEVAVKLPLPHLVSDREFCDAFRSAAHRATRLHHPTLVDVLDYGIEEGRPFVVMEMIEEKTLYELLEAGRKMKYVGALYFTIEMGKVLVYLHEQGITHGSLDERHIFIFPGRKAKVSDPGFPSVMGGAESPHPLSQDPRMDLQDLGYLLYRSLSERGKEEAIEDIKSGRLQWDPEVPPRFQRLVQSCLQSAGGGGFSSAESMLKEAVSTLREEQPMAAVPRLTPVEEEPEAPEEVHIPGTPIPIPHLKRWQIWAGASFLGVALILIVLWIISSALTGSKVEVPNLVNVSVEEAAKIAEENDLGLQVVGREYDADVNKDYVISQSPKAGEMVDKDTTVIKVLQSLGPLTVPNLIGLTLEDARNVLEERGFEVGEIVYREVPGYSEDRVVETDPPYGSKLSAGDPVDLVVNRTSS